MESCRLQITIRDMQPITVKESQGPRDGLCGPLNHGMAMAFQFGDEAILQTKFANGYNTNQICTSLERLINMQGYGFG